MNTQELLEQYAKGERDFCGADLRYAHLRGAHLSGADLSGADLRYAHLRGAHLSGADLRYADLSGADLSGADLSVAHLRGAHLPGAHLSGADLSVADLRYANLSGADLSGADLSGAHLSGADLSGANLPTTSHDAIAEILRRAAGKSVNQRMTAGCVLVSRDWCWKDFTHIILHAYASSTFDDWMWALEVLEEWECFRSEITKIRLYIASEHSEEEKETIDEH